MESRRGVLVANGDLAAHARRLATAGNVGRGDVALAFEPSWAIAPELLVEGANFYPRIQEDMERARSSIHIIQFGFKPGGVGDVFADLLERRARDGLAVRLIVDENGSAVSGRSRQMFERLAEAGAEIVVNVGSKLRAHHGPVGGDRRIRWNLRNAGHIDHRKVVIVDGRIGWVGGAGFEDHFADGRFHDLFVRFEGEAVSQLQLVFAASFRYHTGRFPDGAGALFPSPGPRPDDAVEAVVAHNAPGPYRPITTAIRELIESATETLDVVNPYVTDRPTIGRLVAAARRGVRVRLVVPAEPNNWACGAAEKHHHPALLAAGVQIAEHPAMVHAKALVRDGRDVLVGTCNLEAWSFKRFYEIDFASIRRRSPSRSGTASSSRRSPSLVLGRWRPVSRSGRGMQRSLRCRRFSEPRSERSGRASTRGAQTGLNRSISMARSRSRSRIPCRCAWSTTSTTISVFPARGSNLRAPNPEASASLSSPWTRISYTVASAALLGPLTRSA